MDADRYRERQGSEPGRKRARERKRDVGAVDIGVREERLDAQRLLRLDCCCVTSPTLFDVPLASTMRGSFSLGCCCKVLLVPGTDTSGTGVPSGPTGRPHDHQQ